MKVCLCIIMLFGCFYQANAQENTFENVKINGTLGIGQDSPKAMLDVTNTSENTLKSVLARISEGSDIGEGTYLGVKSYASQPRIPGGVCDTIKSFAIEHKFYGQLNSAINFYRGFGELGGSIRIAVNDGRELCRFFWRGMYVDGTIQSNALEVAGLVRAREVKIENTNWPDYVFSKDYQLPSLSEVSKHIEENKHLPGIPSAKEVEENGVNLSEMNAKLLQKIEELTLYMIQQEKRIEVLEQQLNHQK